jgi:hypothetical protein
MNQNSEDVPMQDETVTQIDTSSKPPQ